VGNRKRSHTHFLLGTGRTQKKKKKKKKKYTYDKATTPPNIHKDKTSIQTLIATKHKIKVMVVIVEEYMATLCNGTGSSTIMRI
jgi:hypothetical protein